MQTQAMEQQQQHVQRVKNLGQSYRGSPVQDHEREDEEMTRSALSEFRAKEEQIEKKKMEVREKVFAQLGRVEEETKRLAEIKEELEEMVDPTRKEVVADCTNEKACNNCKKIGICTYCRLLS